MRNPPNPSFPSLRELHLDYLLLLVTFFSIIGNLDHPAILCLPSARELGYRQRHLQSFNSPYSRSCDRVTSTQLSLDRTALPATTIFTTSKTITLQNSAGLFDGPSYNPLQTEQQSLPTSHLPGLSGPTPTLHRTTAHELVIRSFQIAAFTNRTSSRCQAFSLLVCRPSSLAGSRQSTPGAER